MAVVAVLALAGAACVLVIPAASSVLPWGDGPEPNAAQLAATAMGILLLTGAGLWWMSRVMGLTETWFALTFAYNAGIVVVKFILSPAAYLNARGTTFVQYVSVGVAVMILYAPGLVAIHVVARRNRAPKAWSWASRLTMVVGLVAFALASRFFASIALDRAAADYLTDVFSGAGLWLPGLIVVVCVLAVEAFDSAAHPTTARDAAACLSASQATGIVLIAVYHLLWAIFMVRLFR